MKYTSILVPFTVCHTADSVGGPNGPVNGILTRANPNIRIFDDESADFSQIFGFVKSESCIRGLEYSFCRSLERALRNVAFKLFSGG